MSDQDYLEKALTWVQQKGFFNIKAVHDDFETPSKFTKVGEEEPYVPNITGFLRGSKHYVEVATKSEDEGRVVSKWKLLSMVAANKGGRLYLLAPRGHKSFTQQLVKDHQITARVVYLQ